MSAGQSEQQFATHGFVKLTRFFTPAALIPVKQVVDIFHQGWCADNLEFYRTKAVNSSGLTSGQYLTPAQREILFNLISNRQLLDQVKQVIPRPLFMGTQLFFDPVTPEQRNYWHRDPQYHLSVDEQKAALGGPEVLHLRIPLTFDPGIEVIPGSHKNWDSAEELQVRLEQNGRKNDEQLGHGVKVPLQLGDVLLFSANMIHRGLYGENRLALDILYCEPAPQLLEFIQPSALPKSAAQLLSDPSLFLNISK